MSRVDERRTTRVGICFAGEETFWWAADTPSQADCPMCSVHDEEYDYAANHRFYVPEPDWERRGQALAEAEEKLERVKKDYLSLSRWAGQQNAGNAFATQVRQHADAMMMQWDQPLEEWEP